MASGTTRWLGAGLVVAILASLSVPTSAQQRRRRGFGGVTGLLRIEEVQKELKLTDKQVGAVEDFLEEQREARRELFRDYRDMPPKERSEKSTQYAEKLDKQIGKLLKPEQVKRLDEIEIQQSGARVLGRAKFAKAVKLTKEQRGKIQALQIEQQEAQSELFREFQDGDREAILAKFRELRESYAKKILAALTQEQRGAFKKLAGKPFEMPED